MQFLMAPADGTVATVKLTLTEHICIGLIHYPLRSSSTSTSQAQDGPKDPCKCVAFAAVFPMYATSDDDSSEPKRIIVFLFCLRDELNNVT